MKLRFAPSPTGNLHVGNVRQALINYLLAMHNDGVFYLRMDDTDQERSTDEYAANIRSDLEWLGFEWSELPNQLSRMKCYEQVAEELKAKGLLYDCYETPEELDIKRKLQIKQGKPPVYDRAGLNLSNIEKAEFTAAGRQPHWRFKLDDSTATWADLVRGHVEIKSGSLSDPVLIRADGTPLYTITSCIDDVDHDITHIIRGEDHVSNTAVQLQVFKALGRDPASLTFAHTSLLVNKDGSSLSKRLGSLSIAELRKLGVEPMAINSLLARLGTSMPIEPVQDLTSLAAHFDLATFSRASPKFDIDELKILNSKVLSHMSYEQVVERLQAANLAEIDADLWNILRENIDTLAECKVWREVVFGEIESVITEVDYIKQAKQHLPTEPWSTDTWKLWTSAVKEATGRKGKQLFMPLRQAITGQEHGPEMKLLLPIIGYDKTIQRLLKAND